MTPKDPNFSDEARRYDRPIASRAYILSLVAASSSPITARQIAGRLELTDAVDKRALKARLAAMLRSGELVMNARRGYRLPAARDLLAGVVSAHPEGFGFLMIETLDEDVYLSAREMQGYLHGDKVLARVLGNDARGRPQAEIVKVVERVITEVIGRLVIQKHQAFVEPLSRKVHQTVRVDKGAAQQRFSSGDIVSVCITDYASSQRGLLGEITDRVAEKLTPEVEIDIVLQGHDIPVEFPGDVLEQASRFPSELTARDLKYREDLRSLPFVTIDGSDAKDFDDAVYAEPTSEGYHLLVAIADVGHYVKEGSPLYQEAENRGTSVYFPERVIPMLPERLSNGLCSLRPDEDRLVLVCSLNFDQQGQRTGYRFFEAVIRSKARLIYAEVAGWMAGEPSEPVITAEVEPSLSALQALYQCLMRRRQARGALEIETTELNIGWDAEGDLINLAPVERTEAHKLIEECMLAANVAMADFIKKSEQPGLYRVHDEPDADRVERLTQVLGQFGVALDAELGHVTTQTFQRILDLSRDLPASAALQMLVLRTMNQAIYTPDERPHFGLNYAAYAHFTSPIRRLSDLVNHLLVKKVLQRSDRRRRNKGVDFLDLEAMVQLGERASATERRADMAVYEVLGWLKCEYLKQYIGDTFEGLVTTVVKFGLFVNLEPMMAEGLVHIGNLPKDRYRFDPEANTLTANVGRLVFSMGDRVAVQLDSVDSTLGQVSLSLIQHFPAKRRGAPFGRRKPLKSTAKSRPNSTKSTKSTKPRKSTAAKGRTRRGR